MGKRNRVLIGPERNKILLRKPSAAMVPSTVAKIVVPDPIIKLLTIARRQTSAVASSSNQRTDQPGTG